MIRAGYPIFHKVIPGEEKLSHNDNVYHYFNRDIGWLELHTSPQGVRSISFMSDKFSRLSQPTPAADSVMALLVSELDGYFSKELRSFAVPLDIPSGTPFLRAVWEELTRIPYGETRSYGQVAHAVGNPGAARAVGSANHRNSIPILIPCHRVIKGDGTLGGYASGLAIKKTLLDLEGAALPL
jgi:methylated-DNA-[protein]-cysteine S-methyltransferase